MDRFDDRPARAILFLGHSRVYYNHMPDMVRELADATNVPEKYQITMRALPGASLESLWKDAKVQRLLEDEHWDDVIIQGETRAHENEIHLASFKEYGELLIGKAKQRGARTTLILSIGITGHRFSRTSLQKQSKRMIEPFKPITRHSLIGPAPD